MIFRQHVPGFVEMDDEDKMVIEVLSTEELLNIDWVAQNKDSRNPIPFWRYSQSKYGSEWMLLVEYKNEKGYEWYVLGYIDQDINLPQFEGGKK